MTVTADNKRRVVLPAVKPGDLFEVQLSGEGRFILTKLEPVQPKAVPARLEKRGKYTVLVTDHPISLEAVKTALADFP